VQAAQQAVAQAEANLERLRNAAGFGVQQAQTAVRQAQAVYDLKLGGATAQDIAIAAAAVEQAEAQVRQAEANLEAATLTAPFSGTVGTVTGNAGEMLPPGASAAAAIMTLVDTRQIRVDVAVDEADVAKVQLGQEVALTFDALPRQRVPGRVQVVAPTATVQQGVVTYVVQIHVDPADAQGVKPGMTATANIVTSRKEDAILVPNRALKMDGNSAAVEVIGQDGKPALRRVETGLVNDEFTEIVSGLAAGEQVVMPRTALDGTLPPRGTLAGTTGAPVPGASNGSATGPAGLGPQRGQQ
jgi:HlyD family secretion protein